jgi:hypothetical protein
VLGDLLLVWIVSTIGPVAVKIDCSARSLGMMRELRVTEVRRILGRIVRTGPIGWSGRIETTEALPDVPSCLAVPRLQESGASRETLFDIYLVI